MLGKRYGMLTITSEIYTKRSTRTYKVVDAVCDCGKKVYGRQIKDLLKAKMPSCGCFNTKKRPDRVCPVCGKNFNHRRTKFCSKTCMGKWFKENGTGGRPPKEPNHCYLCEKEIDHGHTFCRDCIKLCRPIPKISACPICGIMVYHTDKHKSDYCSKECKEQARIGIRNVKRRPDTPKWRKQVTEAAKGVCQVCGERTKHLVAHHRKNMRDCSTKEEANDVANGIAMCKPCHKQFHSTYGHFNNTPEEVDEFIERFKRYGKHIAPESVVKKHKPKHAPKWTKWYGGVTRWTTGAKRWGKEVVFNGSIIRYCPRCDQWLSPNDFVNDRSCYCTSCQTKYKEDYKRKRHTVTI